MKRGGRQKKNYDITNQPTSFSEEECRNVKVRISANRYEPWESTVDFLNLQERLKVTLHRAEGKREYTIILANGKKANMTLKSKNFDGLGDSPLEGYSFDGRILQTSLGYRIKYW